MANSHPLVAKASRHACPPREALAHLSTTRLLTRTEPPLSVAVRRKFISVEAQGLWHTEPRALGEDLLGRSPRKNCKNDLDDQT